MPPKFRWDIDYLQSLELELEDSGLKLLCLSPVSFRLVADMSAMLQWPTRFGLTRGEEVPDLADIAYQEINNPMNLVDLTEVITILTDLTEAVRQLKLSTQFSVDCCETYSTLTEDPEIEFGDGSPPPTYGGGDVEDWDEYQNYVCAAAYRYADAMVAALDKLEDAVDNALLGVGAVAIIASIFAAPAVGLILAVDYALAAGIFTAIADMATGALLGDLKLWMLSNRNQIAATITCAGSAQQAYTDLFDWWDEQLAAGQLLVMRAFPIENAMNVIYSGTDADGNNLELEPNDGCGCEGSGHELSGLYFWRAADPQGVIVDTVTGEPMGFTGEGHDNPTEIRYGRIYEWTPNLGAWASEGEIFIGTQEFQKTMVLLETLEYENWLPHPAGTTCGDGYAFAIRRQQGLGTVTVGHEHDGVEPLPTQYGKAHTFLGCCAGYNNGGAGSVRMVFAESLT